MNLERILVATGLLLLPALWLQSLLHQAPRFAGSLAGGALGVAAALSMLAPLVYSLVKRLPILRFSGSSSTVLRWHVLATTAGALLAILHSGHRVQSLLGLLLVAAMLLCMVSGYVGRHYLHYVALDLRDRQAAAVRMHREYEALASRGAAMEAAEAAQSLADLEYSVSADEWIRDRLRTWLWVHLIASGFFYLLLAAHIVAALLYGARWLA